MNLFMLEVVVSVAVIVLVNAIPIEYYASKYDHLDIEEILNNRRMVKYYANCLLNRGPCTPQGLELRRILPEALETNCLRCTEKQKVVTYQSIKRLRKEYSKTWALLEAQWDPKNVYVKRFEESFKQKPSTVPPENEIVIENRFGNPDDETTKSSTTKQTKPKERKPTPTLPTTKSSRIPSINSIPSASEKKPSRLPQNNQSIGGNVANQVGVPNQDDSGGKRQQSSNLQIVKYSSTPRTTSSSSSSIFSSSVTPLTQKSPGVTFDIPQSSVNHTQTKILLQGNIPSTINPQTTTKRSVTVKNKQQPTRQFDPISQLFSSFLNANQPSTSKPRISTTSTTQNPPNLQIRLPKISGLVRKAGVRNRPKLEANTTIQISLGRPGVQVRLPGLTVNTQVQGFNPVGNLVRGFANAGDRLIETGTSIADSVLTSVRGLFTPQARKNRALRRS